MATKDAVVLGTDFEWTLIYDANINGNFAGGLQKIGGGPAQLRVAEAVPLVTDRGFVATEYPVPFSIDSPEKLYGRSERNATIILA
ncbi:hypothetical protein KAR91_59410 [Candidatus Pacearchaeota archaeon]|nr:hypothetical protein [Candidatus Pacearchaeota archaeon]